MRLERLLKKQSVMASHIYQKIIDSSLTGNPNIVQT